ncbi:hypothetical protein [Oceanicoccus sagamiensis]|uniref:Phycocyanobilin:ferredoxin oxidoreductase n=1 Tax=Oceanicoccus sagamiensis TaxID=716816 RepID=A0A1X9NAF0_9GAMM|nr:hypothetical protein [Oceanicoccus sagamiensis]ARN73412.1 hypothetical protein BST96_04365 [Oceanicoccus sagamiensis]
MNFKNPLSQHIFATVKEPLQLTIDEQYQDLHTINTLKGDAIGSVHVFHGTRLEKMVISEFITGPGMVASLVVIKPDYQYDVPRFGSDFSVMNDKLHLDLDLFPHKDLAADGDYYEQAFASLEKPYTSACEQFTTMAPRGLWLRNYISPYFFMTDAEPTDTALEALQALTADYLQSWLAIWAEQDKAVSDATYQNITQRAAHFERLSMQHNPVKNLFSTILGEELALRSLSALY